MSEDARLASPRDTGGAEGIGWDVYVHFDNGARLRAPVDALPLAARSGLAPFHFPSQAGPA